MTRRATWKVPVALTEYTVRTVHRVEADDDECQGLTEFPKRTISLHADLLPRAHLLTFWHEYLHAALHELGHHDLGRDEAFVEGLAQTLSRAIIAAPKRYKSA